MPRLLLAALLALSLNVSAAGEPEFSLALEGHKFTPDRIEVPAGKKVKLMVENKDATPAEFESESLKIEKVIAGKSKATIFVGPLKAGEYKFVDEYNERCNGSGPIARNRTRFSVNDTARIVHGQLTARGQPTRCRRPTASARLTGSVRSCSAPGPARPRVRE